MPFFDLNKDIFKDIKGNINLHTNISFYLDNRFKIKNLLYNTRGIISYLELSTEEKKLIKQYLPEYDPTIIAKNINIKFIKSKSKHVAELDGAIKVKEKFDNFTI